MFPRRLQDYSQIPLAKAQAAHAWSLSEPTDTRGGLTFRPYHTAHAGALSDFSEPSGCSTLCEGVWQSNLLQQLVRER